MVAIRSCVAIFMPWGGKFRGVVEALGGFFRGKVEIICCGKRIVIDPDKNTLEMYTTEGHTTLILRFDTSSDGWEYGDLILRKYAGDQLILETTVYPGNVSEYRIMWKIRISFLIPITYPSMVLKAKRC